MKIPHIALEPAGLIPPLHFPFRELVSQLLGHPLWGEVAIDGGDHKVPFIVVKACICEEVPPLDESRKELRTP